MPSDLWGNQNHRQSRWYEEALFFEPLFNCAVKLRSRDSQGDGHRSPQGAQEGLTAAKIKDATLDMYPHRASDSFYTQVFIAVSRKPGFKKLREKTYILAT